MRRRKAAIFESIIVILTWSLLTGIGRGQQPLLQITSPANNSLATEGTTITISVSADSSVQNIFVLGTTPLPDAQATSSMTQFTLSIPSTVPPGSYNLTAFGTSPSGEVESSPIAIDVETQFLPTSMSVSPTVLTLHTVGDHYPIHVMGTFNDGTVLDVTRSSRLAYSSSNTKVATVDSSGITAVGAGQASIVVQAGASVGTGLLVTVLQQPATGTPPHISSVAPASATPGITQVTISGFGFGASQGSGYVQLGTLNGTVSSWSDSQIVATAISLIGPQLPAGKLTFVLP